MKQIWSHFLHAKHNISFPPWFEILSEIWPRYAWQLSWDSPTQQFIKHIRFYAVTSVLFGALRTFDLFIKTHRESLLPSSGEKSCANPTKLYFTLPVDQVRMGHHPGFENPTKLDVTLGRRQQLVILVATWDVHFNLRDGQKPKKRKVCDLRWTRISGWAGDVSIRAAGSQTSWNIQQQTVKS